MIDETTLIPARTETVIDAARYRRLRIPGAAPEESENLVDGTVLRFTNLDEYVDNDIADVPSRGEASRSNFAAGDLDLM